MSEKLKVAVEKLKAIPTRVKAVVAAAPAAVATAITTVEASAETVEANNNNMESLMNSAGEQLTGQFGTLVSTIIPVVLGILGSGLVIFGIFALIKFAKKIFGKVAG